MIDFDALMVSVRIDAPPSEVFPYLVDSALIVQWIGERAELRPEPGGVFAVDIEGGAVRGEFVVVEPPHRVVFTWGLEGSEQLPAGSTRVEIILTPDGDGTVVDLIHRDLPGDQRAAHEAGWTRLLGVLTHRLSRA